MPPFSSPQPAIHNFRVYLNNLANATTTGFKAERTFARVMGDALPVIDTRTDMRVGTLQPTGSELDFALEGGGFFVVETAAGERLTRGGSFSLDEAGRIADANGNLLLGESGPISAAQGAITVDRGGLVRVDGKEVDRLRVETVPEEVRLQHDSGNLFLPEPARQPAEVEQRGVRQGFLEDSNVNTVGTLVNMISIQRAYSSVQKVVTTLGGVRGTISNDLGKPV
ncbi:MAG: flagellar hook basal-body protein [Gemmatimonadetes bacterium]|nr:flagellar hook basal-body protein [Gemmatimonadota bacterium]